MHELLKFPEERSVLVISYSGNTVNTHNLANFSQVLELAYTKGVSMAKCISNMFM